LESYLLLIIDHQILIIVVYTFHSFLRSTLKKAAGRLPAEK
jgi:hypothetical protein